MDFRAVDPGGIVFRKSGKNVSAAGPAGRVSVQIPECPCTVRVHSPGTYRVDLRFPSTPAHEAFVKWVADVEAAAESSRGAWGAGAATKSPTLYFADGVWTMRLMAFSDTLVFDERGELSADIRAAKKCAALVDLTGAWSTEARWGLRLKVTQLKFWRHSEHVLKSDECMF